MFTTPLLALAVFFAHSPIISADDQKPAMGTVVSELGPGVMYVFHAKNNDYWFGSNDHGVYRYDGKTLVNFTKKDGLVSQRIRGIQEDTSGNIYFTTYEGISRFNGRAFTTLTPTAKADPTEWKLQPDDLWFVGPPDAGIVFRYDGTTLHRLAFPKTKLGDEHLEKMPRSRFPNAIYSPYDIYCIVKDRRGHVWFGSTCVGVCRFDGKSFDWLTDPKLIEAPVRSIFEDRKGHFWFTYTGHSPFEGFRPLANFGRFQKDAEGTIVPGMSILEDRHGHIWTAALREGVYRYDGKQKTNYPIQVGNVTNDAFAVYKDNRGDLWVGTNNGGAFKFNGKSFELWKPVVK